jgi:hypothetical protein
MNNGKRKGKATVNSNWEKVNEITGNSKYLLILSLL